MTSNDADFRRNNFDLIRIFAATQVLVFHVLHRLELPRPWFFEPLASLDGVPIFFIVSGFLVSASLERSPSLLHYARNRATRIFPGLWVCIMATVVVAASFGFSFTSAQGIMWFTAQLIGAIFTPGFLANFGSGSYNGSLWTITIELQFYVVLPVLYAVARLLKLDDRMFWISFFTFAFWAAVAVGFLFPDMSGEGEATASKLLRYSLVPHLFMFLLGVVMQRLAAYRWTVLRGKFGYWICLYYLLQVATSGTGMSVNPLVESVMMVILGITALSAAYTLPHLAHAITIGTDLSYGVYIYHGLIINILIEFGMKGHGTGLIITLVGSYLFAALSWFFVEKPALIWGRARQSGRQMSTPH